MTLLAQQNQMLARQNQELMSKLLEKDEQPRNLIEDGQRVMVDSVTRLMKLQQQNTETVARQNEDLKARLLEKDEQLRRTMKDSITSLTKENTETLARQNEKVTAKLQEVEEQVETQAKELRKEMNRIEVERSEQAKGSSADMQEMRQTVTEIKEGLNAMNAVNMGALDGRITELQSKTAPIQIVMANYERHKRDNDRWYSDGFYTHSQGCKMCLSVHANGAGKSEGTHVSCYIYLMRGEFDNNLKWPFRGAVTITLLNQREDNHHLTHTVSFHDQTPNHVTARVTSGERAAIGPGQHRFIPLSELGYNRATKRQYLVNSCLYFRVKVEMHTR